MKTTLTMYNGDHEPVGWIFTLGDTQYGMPVLITRLYVLDKYRGHGHGRALLRALCTQADRENKDLLLSVQPDPEIDESRLLSFYESFGFTALSDGTTMLRKWVALPKVVSRSTSI